MDKVKKGRLLKDVTITHVSYVKRGANKKQFFLAKSMCNRAEIEFPVKFIAKNDEDASKKLLYGIVYEPDTEDSYGDLMTRDEIEKTAHEFLEFYRNIDTEHNLLAGAGVVVESYVAPVPFSVGDQTIKAGSWVLVTRASDEIWDAWQNGDITGYSMFGITRETQMSKGEPTMKSWFNKMFEALGITKSFDETMAGVIEKMTSCPFFIMDIMQEDFFNNISWDSATEEQLTALSASMKSAAEYIDKKISDIAKSDPAEPETPKNPESTEPEAAPEPEPEPEQTEPAKQAKPEVPAEPAQPVTKSEPAEDAFQLIAKSIGEQVNASIKEMEQRFETRIAGIEKSISETTEKLNETVTRSTAVVPSANQAERTKPKGYGLI